MKRSPLLLTGAFALLTYACTLPDLPARTDRVDDTGTTGTSSEEGSADAGEGAESAAPESGFESGAAEATTNLDDASEASVSVAEASEATPSIDDASDATTAIDDRVAPSGQSDADASGPEEAGCTVSTTRCSGAFPQTCEASGAWATGAVTQGQCGAQCTPASTPACSGAVPQTCSPAGVLTTGAVTQGQCGAQCTPASTPACSGAIPQTCSPAGVLTTGTVTQGQCGAICTPNAFQCGTSQIGQVCGALGTWISNGSSDPCVCYVPGRFTEVGTSLARDSTTGLTWDRVMRSADTWTNASAICNGAGMRLPLGDEWAGVALLSDTEGMGTCSMNPAPFDQAAMPTSRAELCGGTACSLADLWTGAPEPGFPGDVYVQQFFPPGGPGSWSDGTSDDATTGVTHPYRCVK